MNAAFAIDRCTKKTPIADYETIARIHREQISSGFLTTLGERFLSLLYQTLAESSHSFLFVVRCDSDIHGFISGSTNTGRVYIDFAKKFGFASLPLIMKQMLSPKKILNLMETLLYPGKQSVKNLPKNEILNFCVSERFQRTGIGKSLFFALVHEFRLRGLNQIKILTGRNQIKAQHFYRNIGAKHVGNIELHKGIASDVFIYDITLDSTMIQQRGLK